MEKSVKSPLKRSFIYAVSCTTAVIAVLSLLTIFACYSLQKMILPDSNEAILEIISTDQYGEPEKQIHRVKFGQESPLPVVVSVSYMQQNEFDDLPDELDKTGTQMSTAFRIEKIENAFSALSAKKQAAYMALSAAKIVLPMLYSLMGIFLCAAWFYKTKLSVPIELLVSAAQKIAVQNLDFEISYPGADEMGLLCQSFEEMRLALYKNNRELWEMVESRRTLMASVAHDLRNPIAIMEGYLEYLQAHIGTIPDQDVKEMVDHISVATKRLEGYTNSLRDVHQIEEQELCKTECDFPAFLDDLAEELLLAGKKQQLAVKVINDTPPCKVILDGQILYRILENLFFNSLRFARSWIQIRFELTNDTLIATITDDGPGFPDKLLQSAGQLFFTTDTSGQHMGLGIAACNIFSRKHGGGMILSNLPEGGACATVRIAIKSMMPEEKNIPILTKS